MGGVRRRLVIRAAAAQAAASRAEILSRMLPTSPDGQELYGKKTKIENSIVARQPKHYDNNLKYEKQFVNFCLFKIPLHYVYSCRE